MNSRVEKISFDVAFARKQFPFFELKETGGWAFFDNAGGTFPCRFVVEKLEHFYRYNKVQPYGDNPIAAAAGEQMDQGRQVIKALLGVPLDTITIGPSSTQNLNTLSAACTGFLKSGDEIIVSEQDHEANIGGWQRAASLTGASLKLWAVKKDGDLDLKDLETLLTRKTKVVCVTHSSNIVGTLNPIEKIIDMGHAFGAKVVIDGVSFAPHHWPDLSQTTADAYCFSTYKTYATHLGIMYIAPGFLEMLAPQCHFFNAHRPWSKLDTAGPDHAAIAALSGLEDYFETLYHHHFGASDQPLHAKAAQISSLMNQHEAEICSILLKALCALPVKIIGKTNMDGREANVSLISYQHTSARLSQLIAQNKIAAKHGHFYAHRLIDKMGLDPEDGVLRLSFAHYNTLDETRRLVEGLTQIF